MRKLVKLSAGSKASQYLFAKSEVAVIRMICRQYSNQEMADKLGLSIRTIEGYRDTIFKKTRAKNSVGVVLYALRHGIFKI